MTNSSFFDSIFSVLSPEEAVLGTALAAFFVGGFVFASVLLPIFTYLLKALVSILMFKKMDYPTWKCFIPFYSEYLVWVKTYSGKKYIIFFILSALGTFLSIIGNLFIEQAPVYFFLSVIVLGLTIYSFVLRIKFVIRFSCAFGYKGGFAVGLFFLEIIFTAILSFGDAQYLGNKSEELDKKKTD